MRRRLLVPILAILILAVLIVDRSDAGDGPAARNSPPYSSPEGAGNARPAPAPAQAAPLHPASTARWAFQPPVRPSLPVVRRAELARNEVDLFILAKLEEKGIAPGPEAGRETLIRRVSFGLTGLPPSPAEIDAFVADESPGAYERMVERYLASPHHGERWGGHWLDASGYADSNGYFSADTPRPLAHLYRDYVIGSVNADKPFDRFVAEQLAGDELAGYEHEGDVRPEMVELLTATHFLRNPQDGTGESDGNPVEVLADKMAVLDGVVQEVGSCLLGLTLQCARCHDHKYDPVSQAEYYRLRAVFACAYDLERWTKPQERLVSVGMRREREERARRTQEVDAALKALKKSLEDAAAPLRKALWMERLHFAGTSSLKRSGPPPRGAQGVNRRAPIRTGKVTLDDLARRFEGFAEERKRIEASIAAKEAERPEPLPSLSVLVEARRDPPVHHVLRGGIVTEPGEPVEPGAPSALSTGSNAYRIDPRIEGRTSSGRRLALARWLTSREHPLLARVTVNRIWQHHFGTGIVATPENFGASGSPPSHPELLDWLACELTEGGWSSKRIHRHILFSAAYRQSSARREGIADADPDGRLLSRFPMRRLDAESIRDAMLAVTGELDRTLYGPPVPCVRGEDGQVITDERKPGAFRRSIYLERHRTKPVTLLEAFDAPLMVSTCARRSPSTTPLQSLALLNSPFVLARARALAASLEREAGAGSDAAEAKLVLAFRLAFGRPPGPRERGSAEEFLAGQAEGYGGDPPARERAWTDLCQMLLASNAFLYVD